MSHISALPIDLFNQIIKNLKLTSLLESAQVNKDWKKYIDQFIEDTMENKRIALIRADKHANVDTILAVIDDATRKTYLPLLWSKNIEFNALLSSKIQTLLSHQFENLTETQIALAKTIADNILKNPNLYGADLHDQNLSKLDTLFNMNLIKANLESAKFITTNMVNANLAYANLQNANLSYAFLDDAYLMHAKLRGANLSYASLTRADLTGADLSLTTLDHCNLYKAKMEGCILINAEQLNDTEQLQLALDNITQAYSNPNIAGEKSEKYNREIQEKLIVTAFNNIADLIESHNFHLHNKNIIFTILYNHRLFSEHLEPLSKWLSNTLYSTKTDSQRKLICLFDKSKKLEEKEHEMKFISSTVSI